MNHAHIESHTMKVNHATKDPQLQLVYQKSGVILVNRVNLDHALQGNLDHGVNQLGIECREALVSKNVLGDLRTPRTKNESLRVRTPARTSKSRYTRKPTITNEPLKYRKPSKMSVSLPMRRPCLDSESHNRRKPTVKSEPRRPRTPNRGSKSV